MGKVKEALIALTENVMKLLGLEGEKAYDYVQARIMSSTERDCRLQDRFLSTSASDICETIKQETADAIAKLSIAEAFMLLNNNKSGKDYCPSCGTPFIPVPIKCFHCGSLYRSG